MTPYPSPNFGPRRDGALPDMVVLHYTAMQSSAAALARLCDPSAEVSAHYLISETGEVFQLVDEAARAWHAGAGAWGAVTDVNSRSIGIELANTSKHPFPEPQMRALEQLLKGIRHRWALRPERVIGHSDMAPMRKSDPGPRFDWRRLAMAGYSIWPEAVPETDDFMTNARRFGYTVCSDQTSALTALRQRFRPWATGGLDAVDCGVMQDLANRFPVDRPLLNA